MCLTTLNGSDEDPGICGQLWPRDTLPFDWGSKYVFMLTGTEKGLTAYIPHYLHTLITVFHSNDIAYNNVLFVTCKVASKYLINSMVKWAKNNTEGIIA